MVLALAVAGLGGCQYTAPVGGPGTTIVSWPFSVPPPPPGVPDLPPPGVGSGEAPRPASGDYAGTAKALNNPGAKCDNTVSITGWTVRGSEVSYRGFSGTIARDGGLRMQFGDARIIGGFYGSHFAGRYWRPQPGCTYVLTVDPV
jgi:hypothetical protein